MRQILYSLFFILSIAAALAVLVIGIMPFWVGMIMFIGVQLWLKYVFDLIYNYKVAKLDAQSELNTAKELASQIATIECPCGEYNASEFLYINKDNVFKCPKCNRDFKVDIEFKSVLLTDIFDPNETMRVTFEKLNKDLELNENIINNGS